RVRRAARKRHRGEQQHDGTRRSSTCHVHVQSFVMHSSCLSGKCKRHQLAPPPPPPLDPPPKPPNPPPKPPPPPELPPPPQPPPKGPTPLDQPLHGPAPQRLTPRVGPRPMRPRTRMAMKIRMARVNGN